MVKSKLCLDIEKMGDPSRAHRCFNKKTFFIRFYIFMHRHPAPSGVESGFSYYLRQAYLNKKLKYRYLERLWELNTVHPKIQLWYQRACSKVKEQARVDKFQSNEKVTIYHHEINRKLIKKSSILRLETSRSLLEGHDSCTKYLEDDVKNLLLHDAGLLPSAQTKLLEEVTPCFKDSENEPFLTTPSAVEVRETIDISNLRAAPGNDGIPSLFCKPCWDTIGSALTEVMQEIHLCRPLQPSLST